ncbi:hypothetical protein ACOSP7_018394 [Xanthoceras sorbifolium]
MDLGSSWVCFTSGFRIGTFALLLHQGHKPNPQALKTFALWLYQGHKLSPQALKMDLGLSWVCVTSGFCLGTFALLLQQGHETSPQASNVDEPWAFLVVFYLNVLFKDFCYLVVPRL